MKGIEVRLADICEVITKGTTPSNIGEEFTTDGVRYIRSEMINSSKNISEEGVLYISEETHDKLKRSQLKSGDILFSMAGVYLGKTAILRERDVPANTNQAVALIRVNPKKCNREYIYYFLNLPAIVKSVNSMTAQAAQPNINLRQIGNIPIVLPPQEVQDRVVAVISPYDDLIENNQRQIKLLEEAVQRLYKEWFVDLRFPGRENTKITDGIPEGWHKTTLAEIAAIIKRGISPKYADDGKYTVINQKCIRGSVMDITESRKQEKQYELTLNIQDCDTVICSTGTGTLGRVGQIYGDYPNTTFDSHVTLVRAKENPNFMYHVIKNQQEFLMGMGRGSTNQQELYRNVIENIEVLLPDRRLLLQTEELLNTIHNKIETVYSQTAILTEARDCMLPKLMSGEIEV